MVQSVARVGCQSKTVLIVGKLCWFEGGKVCKNRNAFLLIFCLVSEEFAGVDIGTAGRCLASHRVFREAPRMLRFCNLIVTDGSFYDAC